MQHGPGPTTATSMHRVLPVAPTTVMQAGVLGPHCHRGNGSTGLGPSLPPNVRRNYLLLQGRETDRDRDIAKKPSFAGAEGGTTLESRTVRDAGQGIQCHRGSLAQCSVLSD